MPKLSAATLAERRSHILRAAARCFANNGLRGTTLDDVKRQAGVSTGAIYTYFRSKEEMMGALLELARDGRKRRLERATQGGADEGGPVRLLLNWAAAAAGPKGRHAARIDVNLWAEALGTPSMGKLARSAIDEATRGVGHVVRAQLKARGLARKIDADAAASLIIALYLGLEVQNAVGMKLDVDGIAKVLDALCEDLLASNAQGNGGAAPRARSKRSQRRVKPR
ncbi:MAG: TetR/AcrR family transcriptional regulator [Myxococcales bacterium]|jgi:AcrR family transcriptional regulator